MAQQEHAWLKKYLKHLEGKKIATTGVTSDGFPFFKLEDGTQVDVSKDEEGNGPGWLFGLPEVKG